MPRFWKRKATAPDLPPQPPARPGEPFRSQGDQLAVRNDYNGAVVMYNTAVQDAPHDLELLLSRSTALMMATPTQLDQALQDADLVVRINPSLPQGWMQKGEVLMKMGNGQDAAEAFIQAVGCAQGVVKAAAQRSLAVARSMTAANSPNSPAPIQGQPPVYPSDGIKSPEKGPISPGTHTTTPPAAPANPPVVPIVQSEPTTTPVQSDPASTTSVSPPAPSTENPPISQPPPSATEQKTPVPRPPRVTTPVVPSATPTQSIPTHSIPTQSTRSLPTTNPATDRPSHQTASSQPTRQPTVSRNAAETTNTTLPAGLLDDLDLPDHPPPAYTENLLDPVVLNQKLLAVEQSLAIKNKGCISIRPLTLLGNIDAVQLVYLGMTRAQLTARELGTPTYLHPNFANMAIINLNYPGNTFIDMDMETSPSYEGTIPGTVTISGYSEEYRLQQLTQVPLVLLHQASGFLLPVVPLGKIVNRIRKLQLQPILEDIEGLKDILGLSSLVALQSGFYAGGTRQKQIEYLCMSLTRSKYDAASRFPDLSQARNISTFFLGPAYSNQNMRDFLFQIMIGSELLIRLRKNQSLNTSYTTFMTDESSALIVLAALWMMHVTIIGPSNATVADSPLSYRFVAISRQSQTEALIRFGEALNWPYMGEARKCIETAHAEMISGSLPRNADLWDWLFNLVLPGKIYRHRIMAALVYCSPSVRRLGASPFYDNGLIVKGRSYWPRRSVLGSVLGGRKGVQSVCGWIGPLPSPKTPNVSGWVSLSARDVNIPVPVNTTTGQDSLTEMGFNLSTDGGSYTVVERLLDPTEWIEGMAPAASGGAGIQAKLKAINLTEAGEAYSATSPSTPQAKLYRASLDFEINDAQVTYTLYTNPVFVSAPPCVGSHVMHRQTAQMYLKNVIRVQGLKQFNPTTAQVVVIDALGEGEEIVARAWCAERGRHAIIRRGADCCFTCVTTVARGRTGLGFNVIIVSQ